MKYTNYLHSLSLLICVLTAIATLIFSADILWINTSESIPKGLYKVNGSIINKGNLILFCLDNDKAELAVKRGYLQTGKCENGISPVGKKVIAKRGDHVKIDENGIEINGILIRNSKPKNADDKNRMLTYSKIDICLLEGEYIVSSEYEDSYDSRYFGIIRKDQVIGTIERIV